MDGELLIYKQDKDKSMMETLNGIARHTIAVMGGKGGVGKTTITALLARGLQQHRARVAILDGDVASPTVASVFGIADALPEFGEEGLEPPASAGGIRVMSMNAFVEDRSAPFLWLGPMTASAFTQLYSDTSWGRLDYLLVDTPPGLSDIAITMLQSLPLSGVVVVSTPHALAATAAGRCIEAARQFDKNVTGVVENVSEFISPAGIRHPLGGESACASLAERTHAPLLARLPFDRHLAELCDEGRIEDYAAGVCASLAGALLSALEQGKHRTVPYT